MDQTAGEGGCFRLITNLASTDVLSYVLVIDWEGGAGGLIFVLTLRF